MTETVPDRGNVERDAVIRTILAVCVAFAFAACGGTHLEAPPVVESDYTAIEPLAIASSSPRDAWVVGSLTHVDGSFEGIILRSENGARTWHRIGWETGRMPGVRITSVHVSDRHRAWVGGVRKSSSGTNKSVRAVVLRTEDGGNRFREFELPASDKLEPVDVRDIAFLNDFDGMLNVVSLDGDKKVVSTWSTGDGGRSWSVAEMNASETSKKGSDRRVALDARRGQGFRLRASDRAGVTIVEETASGGKDWMPVSELALGYVTTW